MLTSPDVQRAEARAKVAEADQRAAELQRETASIQSQQAAEAGWQPVLTDAGNFAQVALLAAVPVALLATLVGAGLLFRRHLSLPTRDGRAPLIGFDRELSAEALFRY